VSPKSEVDIANIPGAAVGFVKPKGLKKKTVPATPSDNLIASLEVVESSVEKTTVANINFAANIVGSSSSEPVKTDVEKLAAECNAAPAPATDEIPVEILAAKLAAECNAAPALATDGYTTVTKKVRNENTKPSGTPVSFEAIVSRGPTPLKKGHIADFFEGCVTIGKRKYTAGSWNDAAAITVTDITTGKVIVVVYVKVIPQSTNRPIIVICDNEGFFDPGVAYDFEEAWNKMAKNENNHKFPMKLRFAVGKIIDSLFNGPNHKFAIIDGKIDYDPKVVPAAPAASADADADVPASGSNAVSVRYSEKPVSVRKQDLPKPAKQVQPVVSTNSNPTPSEIKLVELRELREELAKFFRMLVAFIVRKVFPSADIEDEFNKSMKLLFGKMKVSLNDEGLEIVKVKGMEIASQIEELEKAAAEAAKKAAKAAEKAAKKAAEAAEKKAAEEAAKKKRDDFIAMMNEVEVPF
jgi:hypothetical protein